MCPVEKNDLWKYSGPAGPHQGEESSLSSWILSACLFSFQPHSTAQGRPRAGRELDLTRVGSCQGSTMKLTRGKRAEGVCTRMITVRSNGI